VHVSPAVSFSLAWLLLCLFLPCMASALSLSPLHGFCSFEPCAASCHDLLQQLHHAGRHRQHVYDHGSRPVVQVLRRSCGVSIRAWIVIHQVLYIMHCMPFILYAMHCMPCTVCHALYAIHYMPSTRWVVQNGGPNPIELLTAALTLSAFTDLCPLLSLHLK
jgi:hypothetical protein